MVARVESDVVSLHVMCECLEKSNGVARLWRRRTGSRPIAPLIASMSSRMIPNWRSNPPRMASVLADYGWLAGLLLPLCNIAFLARGPYSWDGALLWTTPVWISILLDWRGPEVDYQPPRPLPAWAYLTVLNGLALLQMAAIVLLLQMACRLNWDGPAQWGTSLANLIAMRVVTGTNSCCAGIALAHELIHRRGLWLRGMGRVVLWTVLYDHFFLAHVYGHHRHVATRRDHGTAQYGESFARFWRRAAPGQWIEAWKLEQARLRNRSNLQRWARNRMVHGLAIQLTLLLLIGFVFGPVALAIFTYQAFVAVRLLEMVNYIQHWGLQRDSATVGPAQAWSTRSWWSLHSLMGLPLHADHHCNAGKPFFRLNALKGSPQLPHGYFAMAVMVRVADDDCQQLLKKRLHS
ncbi:MAG: fatty acid desaturase [Methylococcaceae bacterium]|nr:fatty acid desaturase [Methylococcaceae bacterium]